MKIINKFLLISILLLPSSAYPQDLDFFQEDIFFRAPIAYPTAVSNEISIGRMQDTNAVDINTGLQLPIVTLSFDRLQLQLAVEANTWLTLGLPVKNNIIPLINQDFYFTIPFAIKYNNIVLAMKYNHTSTYLTNSLMISDQPIQYFKEFISLHSDLYERIETVDIRMYMQIGYTYRTLPFKNNSWFIGSGVELNKNFRYTDTYIALDLTHNSDVRSNDLSIKILFLSKNKIKNLLSIGVFTSIYVGTNRRGRLNGAYTEEFKFGIIIR